MSLEYLEQVVDSLPRLTKDQNQVLIGAIIIASRKREDVPDMDKKCAMERGQQLFLNTDFFEVASIQLLKNFSPSFWSWSPHQVHDCHRQ
jgi:hypothetical protein